MSELPPDTTEKEYQEALETLYRFVDFSMVRQASNAADLAQAHFELSRMVDLAAALGNPQNAYPILHIAGTKGKGSVSSLCASALQAAGYTVGLYTSPHLEDFAERIQVDGQPIGHAEFVALLAEIRPAIERIPRLSTFEIATAMAFLYFARRGVTAAVIEVGLGGRLDATNICTPLVSVINSLSYDHTHWLGDTLAQIATEKAGIIKPGRPVVLGVQLPGEEGEQARQVVEQIAQSRQSSLVEVGREVQYESLGHTLTGQRLAVWHAADDGSTHGRLELEIRLLGRHQVENAATAYTALEMAHAAGLRQLNEAALQAGFRQAHWPGRFELLTPPGQIPALVVDSAHNRDSARRLAQTVREYFPGQAVRLIFGASEDKDIVGMLDEWFSPAAGLPIQDVIVVKSFHPRAADPQKLAQQIEQHGGQVRIVPEVEDAVRSALEEHNPPALVLTAGSIFVAAGVRSSYFKNLA